MTAAGTRARVRAALTREIVDAARRHLATDGAAGLSLRAVARELGMVSSAVYRYFPSRDELLTTLIVEAYDALGAAAEEAADEGGARPTCAARLHAVCGAVRGWALAHPHEYALVYGSPVPGYAAPQATIGPAARVGVVLSRIVAEGVAAGVVDPGTGGADAALAPGAAEAVGLPVDPEATVGARVVQVWTALFGLISFEVFGQLHNVVDRREEFFHDAVERLGDLLGLPPRVNGAARRSGGGDLAAQHLGDLRHRNCALAQHPRLVAGQVDDRRRDARPGTGRRRGTPRPHPRAARSPRRRWWPAGGRRCSRSTRPSARSRAGAPARRGARASAA